MAKKNILVKPKQVLKSSLVQEELGKENIYCGNKFFFSSKTEQKMLYNYMISRLIQKTKSNLSLR